ncbi:Ornithine cyclodeaminase (fragment) [Shewanella benthica]|uniref:Ornithine cyclodeaminase n=1 Tax=Shewanella benthica TaxID=43661 RepID=A0A330M5N5_9GAMM
MIFNRKTGVPQALVDGTCVIYWRTATISALGADFLARRDVSKRLVLGTGRFASFMVLAHASIRPISEIPFWSRDSNKAKNIVEAVSLARPDIKIQSVMISKSL